MKILSKKGSIKHLKVYIHIFTLDNDIEQKLGLKDPLLPLVPSETVLLRSSFYAYLPWKHAVEGECGREIIFWNNSPTVFGISYQICVNQAEPKYIETPFSMFGCFYGFYFLIFIPFLTFPDCLRYFLVYLCISIHK